MFLLLLALACGESEDDTATGTLDGGEDGAPDGGCVEVGRTLVADTSVAVAPLPFAADEALAHAVGRFEGSATLRAPSGADEAVPMQLGVDPPAAVYAVDMELDSGGDTGPALGAPEDDPAACPDLYAAEVSGTLTTTTAPESGLWLYEIWGGALAMYDPATSGLAFVLDATALGGTYAPDFDPAAYDTAALELWASTTATGWAGELQWSASKDLGDGMGQGVVGPAGSFALDRVE